MDPYSRLIDMMRTQGAEYNEYPVLLSSVISTSPLTIRYNDTVISSGIVCPASMISLSDPSGLSTDESALKAYLKTVYRVLTIAQGDQVFAQRVGNEFYIYGKAVKV